MKRSLRETKLPEGVRVNLRGSVQGMRSSFKSFGIGLILAIILVYLILVAQFASFLDPFIILLAIPPGLAECFCSCWLTGTTLNIMSLMGVVMMVGIVVSNSILIVEFARTLWREGKPLREAVGSRQPDASASGADDFSGDVDWPDSDGVEVGYRREAYAPLARAIIGGLLVSVVVTVYLVPAAYLWAHRKEEIPAQELPA